MLNTTDRDIYNLLFRIQRKIVVVIMTNPTSRSCEQRIFTYASVERMHKWETSRSICTACLLFSPASDAPDG